MSGRTLLFVGAGLLAGYMLGRGNLLWTAVGGGAGYLVKGAI